MQRKSLDTARRVPLVWKHQGGSAVIGYGPRRRHSETAFVLYGIYQNVYAANTLMRK
jgi:hypothetical protein